VPNEVPSALWHPERSACFRRRPDAQIGVREYSRRWAEASHLRSASSYRRPGVRCFGLTRRGCIGPKLRICAQLRRTDGSGCDASALLVVGVSGRSFAPALSFVVQTAWGAMLRPYMDGMWCDASALLVVGVSGRSFAPALSFVVQTAWGAMLRPYMDGMGCDASALLVVGVSGRSFAPALSFVVQTAWGAMLRPYMDGMGCDASALLVVGVSGRSFASALSFVVQTAWGAMLRPYSSWVYRAEASHLRSASSYRRPGVRCFGLTWMACGSLPFQ
jgi:hypothetical protein